MRRKELQITCDEMIITPIPHLLVPLWGGGGEFRSKVKPRKERGGERMF